METLWESSQRSPRIRYSMDLFILILWTEDEVDPLVLSCLKFGAGVFFVVVSLIPAGFAQVCNHFIVHCWNWLVVESSFMDWIQSKSRLRIRISQRMQCMPISSFSLCRYSLTDCVSSESSIKDSYSVWITWYWTLHYTGRDWTWWWRYSKLSKLAILIKGQGSRADYRDRDYKIS